MKNKKNLTNEQERYLSRKEETSKEIITNFVKEPVMDREGFCERNDLSIFAFEEAVFVVKHTNSNLYEKYREKVPVVFDDAEKDVASIETQAKELCYKYWEKCSFSGEKLLKIMKAGILALTARKLVKEYAVNVLGMSEEEYYN